MTETTLPKPFSLSLWSKCLLISLAIHIVGICFLLNYPLSKSRDGSSLFIKTKPDPSTFSFEEDFLEKEPALEEFFAEFFVSPLQTFSQVPVADLFIAPEELHSQAITLQSDLGLLQNEKLPSTFLPEIFTTQEEGEASPPLMKHEGLVWKDSLPLPPADSLQSPLWRELLATTPSSLIDATPISVPSFTPTQEMVWAKPSQSPAKTPPLLFEEKHTSPPLTKALPPPSKEILTQPKSSSLEEPSPFSLQQPNDLSLPHLSNIDDYFPSKMLFALEHRDSFEITPSFFPDEEGYIFSITVTPKEESLSTPMKQTIYFLIDNSSHIEKHKLSVFKKSILKSISALKPHTHFNIFFLGKNATSLSPYNLPSSAQNLQLAETFLEEKNDGFSTFFSSFDLLQNVYDVVKSLPVTEELQTIVLLSAGKSSAPLLQQQKILHDLQKASKGKVNLFSAAVGQNNDLIRLDILSSLCNGKLLYSDTNASFPRKLNTFLKTIQTPIAKDLSVCVLPYDSKAEVSLSSIPSTFYSKDPLVIMGRVNRLCNLEVLIEGKNEEGGILLHSNVSFEKASKTSQALLKEWTLRQVNFLYEDFIDNPEPVSKETLKEAKKILQTVHGRSFNE